MCIFGEDLNVDEDWWVGPIRDNVDYFHTTKFSSLWQRIKNYCINTIFKWPLVKWNPPISYFRRQDYDDDGNFDPLLLNPGHVEQVLGDFNRDRRILMEIYLRTMALFLEEYQILEGIIKLGRVINDEDYSELYDPITKYRQYISPFAEINHQTIAVNRLFRIVRSFDPQYTYEERVQELSSITKKRKGNLVRENSLRTMASTIKSKMIILEKIANEAESVKESNVRRVEKFLEKKGVMRGSKKPSKEDQHQETHDGGHEGSDADAEGGNSSDSGGGLFSFALGWFRKNDTSAEIKEKGSKMSKVKTNKSKTKSVLTRTSRYHKKRHNRGKPGEEPEENEDDENTKFEAQHGTEYSALDINSEMAALEEDIMKHHELSMNQTRYEDIIQEERIGRQVETKFAEVFKLYKKMVHERDEIEGRHKIKLKKEIRKFFKKHFTRHKSEVKNLDYIAEGDIDLLSEPPPSDEEISIPKTDEDIPVSKTEEESPLEEIFITSSPFQILGSTSRLSLTSENIMPTETSLESTMTHEDSALIDLIIEEKRKILEIKQFKLWMLKKMGQYRRDDIDLMTELDRSEHELELLKKKELEVKMALEIEERDEEKVIPPWMKWFLKKRELGLDGIDTLQKLKEKPDENKLLSNTVASILQYGVDGRIIKKVAGHKKVTSFEKVRRETGIVRVKNADFPSISPRNLEIFLRLRGTTDFYNNKSRVSSGKSVSLRSKSSGGSNVVVKKSIFKSGQYGFAVGSKVIKTIYCRSKSFGVSRSSSLSDISLNSNFNSDSESEDSDDEHIDEVLEHLEFEYEWPKTLDNISFMSDKPEYIPLVLDVDDPPDDMDEWRQEPEIGNFIVEIPDQPQLHYTSEEVRAELWRRATIHTERALRIRMRAINDINKVRNLNWIWRIAFDELFHGVLPIFDPYSERTHIHGYIFLERFPIFTNEQLYFFYKLFTRTDKAGVDGITFRDLVHILFRFGDRTSEQIIWDHFRTIIRCPRVRRSVKLIGFEEALEITVNLALGKYDDTKILYGRYRIVERRLQRLADIHPKLLMAQDCF